jgi:hypothetical protein
MKHSPSGETDNRLVSQETPPFLWFLQVSCLFTRVRHWSLFNQDGWALPRPFFVWLKEKRVNISSYILFRYISPRPITVAALSKAWTVFVRSNAGIVSSNPTQDIGVCVRLFCVYVVLCVDGGLAKGWSPVQGVLPTVYRMKKLKKRPKPQRAVEP